MKTTFRLKRNQREKVKDRRKVLTTRLMSEVELAENIMSAKGKSSLAKGGDLFGFR